MNTCVGCLPGVRLPPVLAARQKSPPETAAEGKFLTASNHGREGGVVMVGHNESVSRISFVCISQRRGASENVRLQLQAPCQETKYLAIAWIGFQEVGQMFMNQTFHEFSDAQ